MIEQCITSFVEGRVRLRHPALRVPENKQLLLELIETLPGINRVEVNTRTGSVLLEYDPAQISQEQLLSLAEGWLEANAALLPLEDSEASKTRPLACVTAPVRSLFSGLTTRKVNTLVKYGMLATLGTSLVLVLGGQKGGHVVLGSLFLALNARHIYSHRKCL